MPMTVLGSVLGAVRDTKEVDDTLPHSLGAYNLVEEIQIIYLRLYKIEYDQGLKCIIWCYDKAIRIQTGV